MYKAGIGLLTFGIGCITHAMTTIAVLDTGYSGTTKKLCSVGHYDATTNTDNVGYDYHGHGTRVVKTIEANASGEYCFYIIKVFGNNKNNMDVEFDRAYEHLLKLRPNVINLSMSGNDFRRKEFQVLKTLSKDGSIIFIAAGNTETDLDTKCDVYPACYNLKNKVVVSSKPMCSVHHTKPGRLKYTTGHGMVVDAYEEYCEDQLCGTSISTAIATGKYIKSLFM
jgi:hypothetical protein